MKSSRPLSTRLLNFLGSMNLAISLLMLLAIASVIGTVLQQNQPYTDYEIKFGKFWFELFSTLGLYDVYSAPWFLLILGFLVLSTTVCVIRNTPGFLRDMRQYREKVQEKSLKAMKHNLALATPYAANDVQNLAQKVFKAEKFRFRTHTTEQQTVIAGLKGTSNRWGYWLTHIGIIVICIGGLMDSRLPLMIAEWRGHLTPETRNIPASQVPSESRLGVDSFSFRGSVDIPEGRRANVIFLPVRDGYLVQRLPFEVEVKAFRVEHYRTGQPKSFESDLVIHDPKLEEPFEHTISVNHPLIHRGVAIYQASFGDGGSDIEMRLHPLIAPHRAQDVSGTVFKHYDLSLAEQNFALELTDLRVFNINPIVNTEGVTEQKNIGPSFVFRLRNAAGEAIEYTNYMNPVMIEGRLYVISGVKKSPNDPERFLHIPADSRGRAELFLTFLHRLQDRTYVQRAALATTQQSMQEVSLANIPNDQVERQIVESMIRLTQLFATKGFDGIRDDIQARFPADQVETVNTAFMRVLQASLRAVYLDLLADSGKTEVTDADWQFFDDSLTTLANLPFYGSPWYIQMTSFKQVQASGLQMTRSPGKNIVYFGSTMLSIGVFFLFYVAQRRIWILIKPQEDGQTEVVLAGSTNRDQNDFDHYFNGLQGAFQQALTAKR